MEEDDNSRKRLKKKVLDRWENEGGKLCDDPLKTSKTSPPRKPGRKVPNLSHRITAAGNDNPSAQKGKPIKK